MDNIPALYTDHLLGKVKYRKGSWCAAISMFICMIHKDLTQTGTNKHIHAMDFSYIKIQQIQNKLTEFEYVKKSAVVRRTGEDEVRLRHCPILLLMCELADG